MTKKLKGIISALTTWFSMRKQGRNFACRADFEAWQAVKVQTWADNHARQVPFYKNIPHGTPLADYPVINKSDLMADFSSFNRHGITSQQGWEAFDGDRAIGPYHLGASTGTSGNRGLFVISDEERYLWLGAMLGKLLPDIWRRRERIALILPLHTRLYDATNDTKWLKLGFFDLSAGLGNQLEDLCDLNPTIIVAPPRALRWLAQNAANRLNPQKIYSAAEVLDPVDAALIEAHWPGRLGQIYMATEGIMATTCSQGTIHLAEDVMHFDLEPVGGGLVSPIISDFRRTSQIMCRYRMNDLLRMSDRPCACGSPFRSVDEIVGRQDDCFTFPSKACEQLVTPDILRNAILDADRSITDFRLLQRENCDIELTLNQDCSDAAVTSAEKSLIDQFSRLGISPNLKTYRATLGFSSSEKLRRVKSERHICHGSPS